MDAIVHALSAGVLVELLLEGERRWRGPLPGGRAALGAAALVLGALSHLALDALPHFNIVPHLSSWMGYLPRHWITRTVIVGAIAGLFVLVNTRERWGTAALAVVGAASPDIEKIAHTDAGMDPRYLVFRDHGTRASSFDGGYDHRTLAYVEIGMVVFLALLCLALARRRRGALRRGAAA